jgi:hypothetical protein
MTNPSKAELKQAYKDNPPAAGVYRITNTANGKIFLGKGSNVRGILNSQQTKLNAGLHPSRELQQDFKQFGVDNFVFEIVDELEASDKSPQQLQDDLAALEELWLEKLQPYGERGYNKPPANRSL